MPEIFTIIDARRRAFCSGKRTESLGLGLPPGVADHGEKWVESTPISLAGHASTRFIKGKSDTVVTFDDGT